MRIIGAQKILIRIIKYVNPYRKVIRSFFLETLPVYPNKTKLIPSSPPFPFLSEFPKKHFPSLDAGFTCSAFACHN